MIPRLSMLLSALVILGCAKDEERPPMLDRSGDLSRLVSCDALREQQLSPGDTGQFWKPGGFAQCLADGQYCPTPWLAARCDGGVSTAICVDSEWRSVCVALDGGSQDASD